MPQGSILGLVLLNIYINYTYVESCAIALFANEMAIYISSSFLKTLLDRFQSCLNSTTDFTANYITKHSNLLTRSLNQNKIPCKITVTFPMSTLLFLSLTYILSLSLYNHYFNFYLLLFPCNLFFSFQLCFFKLSSPNPSLGSLQLCISTHIINGENSDRDIIGNNCMYNDTFFVPTNLLVS